MSRLDDLISRVEKSDKKLAGELRREVSELSGQQNYGLNFEHHPPENVRLYGKDIREGDHVNILPPRGEAETSENKDVWKAVDVSGGVVTLERLDDTGSKVAISVDDTVAVATPGDAIYPCLRETGRVERGGDKPYHVVINGENYHALQMLIPACEGKVDAIYIDPPYNSGAREWKYNNDYVDSNDQYKHSKWLAMMERRLKLAKRLLKPNSSVLLVTIDEKEVHRLGLLLEQLFNDCSMQMISIMTNKKGSTRLGRFSRAGEYLFVIYIGNASIFPGTEKMIPDLDSDKQEDNSITIWNSLLRRGTDSRRSDRPNLFYPIYVDPDTRRVIYVGQSLDLHEDRNTVPIPSDLPKNTVQCWPLRKGGAEGRWQIGQDTLLKRVKEHRARAGKWNKENRQFSIVVIKDTQMEQIENGNLSIVGIDDSGAYIVQQIEGTNALKMPRDIWVKDSHDASVYGSTLNMSFIPNRKFPFPKPLYAVEDALRFFLASKKDALVLDFFAGSGTTAHAVMRLNHQDGGRRKSISITNNEVSDHEAKDLLKRGFRQGDAEWESLGICEYITKPRITAAITGHTPEGQPIKGNYKFTDEFPMSDGFGENAVFYTMTYGDGMVDDSDKAFGGIAPLLWIKAGQEGRCIMYRKADFDIADTYAVLFDCGYSQEFIDAVTKMEKKLRFAYIVTNMDSRFREIAQQLPDGVEAVRLEESYIQSFKVTEIKD